MADLFEGYGATTSKRRGAPAWDEMFADPSHADDANAREAYREIHATLAKMTKAELRGRTDALASSYLAQGVTFDFAGEERPFPLDAVPRVIQQKEWLTVESGVKQRVLALERFLADVYGEQRASSTAARQLRAAQHHHGGRADVRNRSSPMSRAAQRRRRCQRPQHPARNSDEDSAREATYLDLFEEQRVPAC